MSPYVPGKSNKPDDQRNPKQSAAHHDKLQRTSITRALTGIATASQARDSRRSCQIPGRQQANTHTAAQYLSAQDTDKHSVSRKPQPRSDPSTLLQSICPSLLNAYCLSNQVHDSSCRRFAFPSESTLTLHALIIQTFLPPFGRLIGPLIKFGDWGCWQFMIGHTKDRSENRRFCVLKPSPPFPL